MLHKWARIHTVSGSAELTMHGDAAAPRDLGVDWAGWWAKPRCVNCDSGVRRSRKLSAHMAMAGADTARASIGADRMIPICTPLR